MTEISIKVRSFRYLYFMVFLLLNIVMTFTRDRFSNTIEVIIEILWFLVLIVMAVSVTVPTTLVLSEDASLCIGKKVFSKGTIKRLAWSNGSRSTFQVIPHKTWTQYRYVTITGWDGMKLDRDRMNIKYWAQQHNIEFTEPQPRKHNK